MYKLIETAEQFHEALQSGQPIHYTAFEYDDLQQEIDEGDNGWIYSNWNDPKDRYDYTVEQLRTEWASKNGRSNMFGGLYRVKVPEVQ